MLEFGTPKELKVKLQQPPKWVTGFFEPILITAKEAVFLPEHLCHTDK